jgi:hypothetical protein
MMMYTSRALSRGECSVEEGTMTRRVWGSVVALAVLLITVAVSTSLLAQTSTHWVDNVYERLSPREVDQVLDDMDVVYLRGEDGVGDPMWELRLNGYKAQLYVYGTSIDNSFSSFLIRAGFSMSDSPSCSHINAWNVTCRGSRAYLETDGDAVIESDLYISGGVTLEVVQGFIQNFGMSVQKFADSIGFAG